MIQLLLLQLPRRRLPSPSQTEGYETKASAFVCQRVRELSLVLKALLVVDLCNWDR